MKIYLIPLVLMLTLMSCRGDLNADFRKVIIEYQQKFPPTKLAKEQELPEIKNPKLKKIYIYQADFYKNDEDTFFALSSNYGVVEDDFYYQGYEIYRDNKVKPIVFQDFSNVSGQLLYRKMKEKTHSLWDDLDDWDTKYTPVHIYKVKNNKIYFDTVATRRTH